MSVQRGAGPFGPAVSVRLIFRSSVHTPLAHVGARALTLVGAISLSRVGARTAGVSTFIVVADIAARPDGAHKKVLQDFGDALLPKLRALGPEWVGTA